MATINPYLTFNGNAEEAFNFYRSVFGGELTVQRFKDTPEGGKMPIDDQEKIMHVSLPIGQGNVLMASDAGCGDSMEKATIGTNFSISINAESKEEADKLFKALSDGGQLTMPMEDTFWGAYFGMLKDKFGIQWMVDYEYNQQK